MATNGDRQSTAINSTTVCS